MRPSATVWGPIPIHTTQKIAHVDMHFEADYVQPKDNKWLHRPKCKLFETSNHDRGQLAIKPFETTLAIYLGQLWML